MKKAITLAFLILLVFSVISGKTAHCAFNGSDYMIFEPGHYLHYTETIDSTTKDLEVVYQETVRPRIFITLSFLDREYYDSSLLGGIASGKIYLHSGFPSRNEHNYWFHVTLPVSFDDGEMWKHNDVANRVEYIEEWMVNGEAFSDVVVGLRYWL